jgi:hypothetical protein
MPTIKEFIVNNKNLILNKKLKVRELDEEPKGVFIAFVDEGKESYDVHISIDDKNELLRYECDCENKKPCSHQVFLAEFISNRTQVSKGEGIRKVTKKIPEHHEILDKLNESTVKDWLKLMMDNNKSVKYEFLLNFKENTFTLDNIELNLIDAISSTTNNRKKLDQLQIKNLLNLFDKINQPIYETIKEAKDLQKSILLLIMISKTLNTHYNSIKSNSKKYESYLDNLFPLLNDSFIKAPVDSFETAIELFIQKAKSERIIRARSFEYLYSLTTVLDMKKKLILKSHINMIEKSNPNSISYFTRSN